MLSWLRRARNRMGLRHALLASAVLMLVTPAMAQAPPDHGVEYEIIIACPGADGGECPIRAVDPQDAMGAPAIAVDPDDPDNMIIASLHGTGDAGGPSAKSRDGQPYTTFTTRDHGVSWRDNPYFEPTQLSGAYGQHPAITLDPYGHVFIGSLYAVPYDGDQRGPDARYDYVIAAQKFSSLEDIDSNQNGRYRAEFIGSVYPGNAIKQTWFVYNRITDNMTMVWNEQVTPYSLGGGVGNGTNGTDRISTRLDDVLSRPSAPAEPGADPVARAADTSRKNALASLASGSEAAGAPTGLGGPDASASPQARADAATAQETSRRAADGHRQAKSTIGVVWSNADVEDGYHLQPREHAIAPCSSSTNPVISAGWLYIGCRVAEDEGPLAANPAAEPGDIEMFRMHPDGGEPQYIGSSPLSGGEPKLGVRSDGRMALMTAEVVEEDDRTRVRLDATYGHYSESRGIVQWGKVYHYGDRLQPIYRDAEYVDVNIQDMIFREYSGVIHMVLKRVVVWDTGNPIDAVRPTIFKAVVAIDENHGVLQELDLGIGSPVDRAQDPSLLAMSDAVFNDLADDFLELPEGPYEFENRPLGSRYQREFFAVGNYGIVFFAELIEITELRGPVPTTLPNPPPPPNPAPASASSQALATAGALTASAMMAGTVATAKRKHVARAGRKKRQ